MGLSGNIRAVRTEKDITQAEVARRLGLERTNYHRLENRGEKLTVEQVESIAQALGVGLVELLTWGADGSHATGQIDTSSLRQEIAQLNEITAHQRDKIKYMQTSCAQLILGMAADEFDLETKLIPIENNETNQLDNAIPDDWLPFLSNFLVANSVAFDLIETGLVDEKTIMRFGTGNGSNVPMPKDIRRKLQRRIDARKRLIGGSF